MRHILWVLALVLAVTPSAMAGWKAGTARVVITPSEPMWMAGYASRSRPAEGKVHDLWLKALALEDEDGNRAVIVSVDVVGIARNIWDNIVKAVEEDVDRNSLMINSSHTHSGPVTSSTLRDIYPLDDLQASRVEKYSHELETKAAETIRAALKALAPAELAVAQGKATFAVNRRNNPELEVPELLARGGIKGPSDHSVPVMTVKDADGKLMAILFAYACHNTVLDAYEWCGDYAGFAQEDLEKQFPGAQAMFISGCGADQNPIPRRKLELAEKYGKELADAVAVVVKGSLEEVEPTLSTRLELTRCDLGPAPTREELQNIANSQPGYQQRWGARLLADLDAGKPLARTYDVPIQVWRLGDLLWIAMGGEVVVDYSLKFHSMFGPKAWVTSYANDVMAYIPSTRVLKEGGYEGQSSMVAYGMPAFRWGDAIEEQVTAAVVRLVDEKSRASR